MKRSIVTALLAAALTAGSLNTAHAHGSPSDASALSMLPIAISVAAPAMVLSGTAMLTVAAVEVSADGTVWVLERASDGARLSVTVAGGVSMAAGTAVTCAAISTGWVLSAAGKAIAFIPNEIGAALLYNERVTR